MNFDSIFFLSCFFPLVLGAYWLIPGTKAKNRLLLILGLVFYAFGSITGIALLLVSALVNYLLGLAIAKRKAQKAALIAGIAANLLFLFVYKYLDPILSKILGLPQPALGLAAPLGISFFTFKAISYLVDISRGPEGNPGSFSQLLLYLSFFPQVVAGPITRFGDFAPQLKSRSFCSREAAAGCRRFILGLSKKVILCTALGAAADRVFGLEGAQLDFRLAWIGAASYMLQIYFDFSGYSDMAIGLGTMLGFTTRENFCYPYAAVSIGDFWRRWHISLGAWFKDYLYIPLGGNRKGKLRTALNKGIVFALCGLWHGCNWTFLVWGLWHGLFSALESLGILNPGTLQKSRPGRMISHIYTLLAVCLGFVIFRAATLENGLSIISAMFTGFSVTAASTVLLHRILSGRLICALLAGIFLALPWKLWLRKFLSGTVPQLLSYGLCLVLYFLCLAGLASGGFTPFIYAQF